MCNTLLQYDAGESDMTKVQYQTEISAPIEKYMSTIQIQTIYRKRGRRI
jgi:hypothetical protein